MSKKSRAASGAETKPEMGRPSKYKSQFCAGLIEHMSKGLSFESFAAVIDVSRDTLYEWDKSHADFSDAKREAYAKNLLFWENHGIEGLYSTTEYDQRTGKPTSSKSMNATVWIFNMKNRHKWRDRQADESDVVINNLSNLSDEDLDAKLAEKLSKLSVKDDE